MRTIKELRKLYNMSQSQFAKRFNISIRTLQQWEQGISSPNDALCQAIYEIYLRESNAIDYEIMCKNKLVAEVLLSKDKKDILAIIKTNKVFLRPFKEELTVYDFYRFIKDRCYEDERDDLSTILRLANLSSNNPYEWIKISHGVTWEDYFWIKEKNENIRWEEVRVRE